MLTILIVYTHNIGWFICLSGGLLSIVILIIQREFSLRNIFIILIALIGIPVLLFLPWIPIFIQQNQTTVFTIDWVRNFWSPWAILLTLHGFIPGSSLPAYVGIPSLPIFCQSTASIIWLLIIASLFFKWEKDKQNVFLFIVLFLLLNLVFPYLYSLIIRPVYLAGRTDFAFLPFWCLATGYAISRVKYPFPISQQAKKRQRNLNYLLCGFFVITGFLTIIEETFVHAKSEKSEISLISYLSQHGKSGDEILCTGLSRPTLEYYLKPKGFHFSSYPKDMAHHLAHINEKWYINNIDLIFESKNSLEDSTKILNSNHTLWVIGSQRKVNQNLLQEIKIRWPNANQIQTPSMGLRKLQEPLFIIKIQKEGQ